MFNNKIHNKQHVCRWYNNRIVLLFSSSISRNRFGRLQPQLKHHHMRYIRRYNISAFRVFICTYNNIFTFDCRTAGAHVTTTFTSSNNLGLVITGLTEADVGTYTCTATYSNSEYLARSVMVDSFCKSLILIAMWYLSIYCYCCYIVLLLLCSIKTTSRGWTLPPNNIR